MVHAAWVCPTLSVTPHLSLTRRAPLVRNGELGHNQQNVIHGNSLTGGISSCFLQHTLALLIPNRIIWNWVCRAYPSWAFALSVGTTVLTGGLWRAGNWPTLCRMQVLGLYLQTRFNISGGSGQVGSLPASLTATPQGEWEDDSPERQLPIMPNCLSRLPNCPPSLNEVLHDPER